MVFKSQSSAVAGVLSEIVTEGDELGRLGFGA